MSFSTLGTTDSAGSKANDNENDGFTPQPVTSKYLSLREHQGVLKDAIGAHPSISMSDTDLPPIKWANAIKGALYEDDGCLGEQQAETPYTTSDFEDQHGDSIATPHDDLATDERTELRKLFKKSDNHDATDLDGQFKLPVVNGDRLPLLVADEDVLEEAIEMLNEFAYNDAGSTTGEVDDDEENDEFTGWDAPMIGDGMPSPDAFTVAKLENDVLPYVGSPENCRLLLEAEKAGKERVTAISAIEAHGNDLAGDEEWQVHFSEKQDDETDDETDDDNDADSTTDDVDAEELAETVSKAVTAAVLEALDN